MTISEVYEKYKIMPQLQEHQLKVAGVAKIILENFNSPQPPLLKRGGGEVVLACLLHDIGNIIKFDLSKSKSLLNADLDLEYWQKVKDEFVEKYGPDEHKASVDITKELGASERVIELVDCVDFYHGPKNAEHNDLGKKICAYSDMRVGPNGVVSLEQRFADLRVRYAHRVREWGAKDPRNAFEDAIIQIEKQIFEKCKITPGDIKEESVADVVVKLKSFDLSLNGR
jgi:hypothetical protein